MGEYDVPALDSPALVRYGYPEYFQAASPAAGAHFVQQISGAFFVRLIAFTVRLVTSGVAGAREVVVQYRDDQANVYSQNGINTTVVAGQTADYFFGAFIPEAVATVNGSALVPLQPIILPATHDFRAFVVNLDAGDQLSRVRFVWERFYRYGQPPSLEGLQGL